jgi:hypothetical protein
LERKVGNSETEEKSFYCTSRGGFISNGEIVEESVATSIDHVDGAENVGRILFGDGGEEMTGIFRNEGDEVIDQKGSWSEIGSATELKKLKGNGKNGVGGELTMKKIQKFIGRSFAVPTLTGEVNKVHW